MLLVTMYGNCTDHPQLQLLLSQVGVHPMEVAVTRRTCYGKPGPGKH